MNKYDSYKDSGLEWIGEIPSHWNRKKLGYLVNLQGRIGFKGYKKTDFVNEGEGCRVIGGKHIDNNNKINLSNPDYLHWDKYYESPEIMVFKGDLIVSQRGTLGKVLMIEDDYGPLTINPSLVVVNQIKENTKFLWYSLQSDSIMKTIDILGSVTTIPMLSQSEISNFPILLPSKNEQQQIVQYLDNKTTLIDSLIEKTQKKIELLKEQRTSLINEVTTKGLNPNVEMKDSGVEWIGKIPSNWKISNLGFYTTKIGSGSTPRGGSEIYSDEGIPFIRSQNVHFEGLRMDDISFIESDIHNRMKGSTVVKNDLLLNITGGSIGRCCIVNLEGEMNVNQHVSIIRTTNKLLNYFLNYLLRSDIGQLQVRYNLTGGNREGLTIEGIRNFKITIPPITEQHQIVQYLDKKTNLIDSTISIEEKRMEHLKEYRQSLISEVVTGKIKVTT